MFIELNKTQNKTQNLFWNFGFLGNTKVDFPSLFKRFFILVEENEQRNQWIRSCFLGGRGAIFQIIGASIQSKSLPQNIHCIYLKYFEVLLLLLVIICSKIFWHFSALFLLTSIWSSLLFDLKSFLNEKSLKKIKSQFFGGDGSCFSDYRSLDSI